MNKLEKQSYKSLYESYKELYNEYERIKSKNEFLLERENKLQMIEMIFDNEPIDLTKLAIIIKEM
ncbi:MAG: hypothetical protein IJ371_06535 [Clostridia bacterium]|nr:hypothetical protein [Clostridia bacterium]